MADRVDDRVTKVKKCLCNNTTGSIAVATLVTFVAAPIFCIIFGASKGFGLKNNAFFVIRPKAYNVFQFIVFILIILAVFVITGLSLYTVTSLCSYFKKERLGKGNEKSKNVREEIIDFHNKRMEIIGSRRGCCFKKVIRSQKQLLIDEILSKLGIFKSSQRGTEYEGLYYKTTIGKRDFSCLESIGKFLEGKDIGFSEGSVTASRIKSMSEEELGMSGDSRLCVIDQIPFVKEKLAELEVGKEQLRTALDEIFHGVAIGGFGTLSCESSDSCKVMWDQDLTVSAAKWVIYRAFEIIKKDLKATDDERDIGYDAEIVGV